MTKVYVPSHALNENGTIDQRVMDGHLRLLNAMRGSERRLREKRTAWAQLGPVVYFVWRHPFIKIGYSANFRYRMYHLQVQPRDILALLPGDPRLEREIHGRFMYAFVEGEGLGKEHFRPVPGLLDYIDQIREKAGVPPLVRRGTAD